MRGAADTLDAYTAGRKDGQVRRGRSRWCSRVRLVSRAGHGYEHVVRETRISEGVALCVMGSALTGVGRGFTVIV